LSYWNVVLKLTFELTRTAVGVVLRDSCLELINVMVLIGHISAVLLFIRYKVNHQYLP